LFELLALSSHADHQSNECMKILDRNIPDQNKMSAVKAE